MYVSLLLPLFVLGLVPIETFRSPFFIVSTAVPSYSHSSFSGLSDDIQKRTIQNLCLLDPFRKWWELSSVNVSSIYFSDIWYKAFQRPNVEMKSLTFIFLFRFRLPNFCKLVARYPCLFFLNVDLFIIINPWSGISKVINTFVFFTIYRIDYFKLLIIHNDFSVAACWTSESKFCASYHVSRIKRECNIICKV